MTGSPASDLNPIFLAARCRLKVQSKSNVAVFIFLRAVPNDKNKNIVTVLSLFAENGTRILKIDGTFFTGYRTNVLRPDEVIIDLFIPFTEKVRRPVR